MVTLVHLQVVSATRAVILVVHMTKVAIVVRVAAVIPAMIVFQAVIQAVVVTPAASPIYTLKVVTNLTVRKDHTSLAVHVNFAQLASTCLTLRVQAVQKSRKDHK